MRAVKAKALRAEALDNGLYYDHPLCEYAEEKDEGLRRRQGLKPEPRRLHKVCIRAVYQGLKKRYRRRQLDAWPDYKIKNFRRKPT